VVEHLRSKCEALNSDPSTEKGKKKKKKNNRMRVGVLYINKLGVLLFKFLFHPDTQMKFELKG
jgi:hypothetical protein